jgi:prepilin-type N-terminal cleavage/methylation domain-containing protein
MKFNLRKGSKGYSLIELIIAMTMMLVLMGIVSTLMARSFSVRTRESRQADALATAQSALSVISREVSNSGFGIYVVDAAGVISQPATNGIVLADSGLHRIRVRANLENAGGVQTAPGANTLAINQPGEDVTYFFDAATKSIVRFDPNGGGTGVPETSVVVNRISNVTFRYFNYVGSSATPVGPLDAPTADTCRVRIEVQVEMDHVQGQPDGQTVNFTSDVTLRNSGYMLQQY